MDEHSVIRDLAGKFMVAKGLHTKTVIRAARVQALLVEFETLSAVQICEMYMVYMNALKSQVSSEVTE